ncbi:MAG: glycosyltransferase family 2 protein [Pseudobdellovibrionaceae bacterium]|nr:glycosyltransferase family 2 protein [Pseudobdellovibrionaceae bacterium]
MSASIQAPAARLLLLVPVYNHAALLRQVLRDLDLVNLPLVIVDDGSTDAIHDVLKEFPQHTVLKHGTNRGKGEALRTGMQWALAQGYTAVLTFDADGQHRTEDIPKLVAAWHQDPSAIYLGVRDFGAASSGPIPRGSKIGRFWSNFFVWVETGQTMLDTQTGLRIYPLHRRLLRCLKAQRYHFEVEILVRAVWMGLKVGNIPVGVIYPRPEERVSHFRAWVDTFRMGGLHIRFVVLRLLMVLGLYRQRSLKSQEEIGGSGLIAWLVQRLGIRFCYTLMILPVMFIFLKESSRRAAIMEFHAQLRPAASRLGRLKSSLSNFWYFGMSLLDRLNPAGNSSILAPTTVSEEMWRQILGQGSIFVGAHYGDWFLVALRKREVFDRPMGLVMDPRGTPEFMEKVMDMYGDRIRIIDPFQDPLYFALDVKHILDDGGHVCFLGDRLQGRARQYSVSLPFLGKEAAFLQAPFDLALRLRVPVLYFGCTKQGITPGAPYQIFLHSIYDGRERLPARTLVERYVGHLETQVQTAPQHWFNFIPFWQQLESEGA